MASANEMYEKEIFPLLMKGLSGISGNKDGPRQGTDKDGNYWAFCPVHQSGKSKGNRTLCIHPKRGFHCFAGCANPQIKAALGIPDELPSSNGANGHRKSDDLPPPPDEEAEDKSWKPSGPPVAVYKYHDGSGKLVAEKARWEAGSEKTFRWKVPGASYWGNLGGLKETDLPLYKADTIEATRAQNKVVYFVEGEKAADAMTEQGFVATTFPMGAGGRDFGQMLQILRGREVALWADNDEAGREHMLRVQSSLRGIAAKTWFVIPPRQLPHKGDAYDYFKLGGTAEELRAGVIQGVKSDHLERGNIRVLHPTKGTLVEFLFRSIIANRREINTELTVRIEGEQPHSQRINVLSSSAVDDLASRLTKIYGKPGTNKDGSPSARKVDTYDWPVVLSEVVTELRKALGARGNVKLATDIQESTGDPFFCEPFLPLDQPTIVFGDGSSGKSLWAIALCVAVAADLGTFNGAAVPGGKVLFIDYEDSEGNWKRRARRICEGLGIEIPTGLMRYDPHGVPVPEIVDEICDLVLEEGIVLVVIDSAAPACGSKPEATEEANFYFDAINQIGITTLTIGHISKGQNGKGPDTTKPFGSSYWHNRARRTWYVEREQETDADEIYVGFLCRKVNDGRMPDNRNFQFTFEGGGGPIVLQGAARDTVKGINAKRPPQDQLRDALSSGHKMVKELATELQWSEDKTSKFLKRYPKLFASHPGPSNGGRPATYWGLLAPYEYAQSTNGNFSANGHDFGGKVQDDGVAF